METIERAAIRYKKVAYSVPRPGRHHDVIHLLSKSGVGPDQMHDQGFVTSTGRFVDRIEGLAIATAANQIKEKTFPTTELFSEDIW